MDDPHGEARHALMDKLMEDREISRPAELAAALIDVLVEGGYLPEPATSYEERRLAAADPGPMPGSHDPRHMPIVHRGRLFLYRGARNYTDGGVGELEHILFVVDVTLDGLLVANVHNADGTKTMVDNPRTAPGTRQVHQSVCIPIGSLAALLDAGVLDLDHGNEFELVREGRELEIRRTK